MKPFGQGPLPPQEEDINDGLQTQGMPNTDSKHQHLEDTESGHRV